MIIPKSKIFVRASGRLGRGPTLECRKENYAWYTRRLIHSDDGKSEYIMYTVT
jgi:hypothetical protein